MKEKKGGYNCTASLVRVLITSRREENKKEVQKGYKKIADIHSTSG
jgi:hypothetical protein